MHLHHSDVKFEEFIELVTDETKVSSADVKAVFDCSTKVLIHLLQDGKGGDSGEMEAFRPNITIKTGRFVESPRRSALTSWTRLMSSTCLAAKSRPH